jgi:hypothetical protein
MATAKSLRADGRVPLLVYLEPTLVKALKVKALQDDTHVYLIVEKLLSDLLQKEVSSHDRPKSE